MQRLLRRLLPALYSARPAAARALLARRAVPAFPRLMALRPTAGAGEGRGGGDPSRAAGATPEHDGLENVQQNTIFKENKKRTQQRKEPCPADSVESLMAEMPFVDTDIEDEFFMHATSEIDIKKKRKRTTGREIEEGSERKKKKKKQYQPNYFISLPITNPEITGGIQAVQDAITQKDQRLSKAMVRSGSLHVTMLVMHLSNEEEIRIAVGALSDSKDFVEDLLKGKTVDLSFQGIDHFKNEVGFVKLVENDHTTILTEIADTQVSEEGRGGGAPGAGAEIPLQSMVKTTMRQAVPLQPMAVKVEQIFTCSPWRTPRQSRWMCPKEAVTLWEAHAGGSWQDLWTHGERSPCWSRFAGRTCDPVERTHAGAVCS
ncbi:A-kinase anchoring protein 7 isoform X4 [Ciconia boyciana]|uniref:A-kinase anchoring protein 7 isoform X4 n=1 Tax=Ciconia boyciana TaxID=52775 RepID=UPI003BA2EC33